MPLDNWTYVNLEAKIVDIMNIAHRFVAQENLRSGKGPGLFNLDQQGSCGESCECNGDMSDFWGYDAETEEPVNLLQHITAERQVTMMTGMW